MRNKTKIQICMAANRCQVKCITTYSRALPKVPPESTYSHSFSRNRYLVTDLVAAIAQKIGHYEANVVCVNPMPAPSKQRVLMEFRGDWPGYKPMSGQDFEPLAK